MRPQEIEAGFSVVVSISASTLFATIPQTINTPQEDGAYQKDASRNIKDRGSWPTIVRDLFDDSRLRLWFSEYGVRPDQEAVHTVAVPPSAGMQHSNVRVYP